MHTWKKFKTKSLKNAQVVEWNQDFTFDLIGLDLQNTDVEVVVYHGNRFVGEVVMPLHEARLMGEGATWYPLYLKTNDKIEDLQDDTNAPPGSPKPENSNDNHLTHSNKSKPQKQSGEVMVEFYFN